MKIGDVVVDWDGLKKCIGGFHGNLVHLQWFVGNRLYNTYRASQYMPVEAVGIVVSVPKELHGRLAESGIAPAWKAEVNL